MAESTVVSHGNSAAVLLPQELLQSLGLEIGDKIQVSVGDRELILHALTDAARQERVESLTNDIFERRQDAFRRLA